MCWWTWGGTGGWCSGRWVVGVWRVSSHVTGLSVFSSLPYKTQQIFHIRSKRTVSGERATPAAAQLSGSEVPLQGPLQGATARGHEDHLFSSSQFVRVRVTVTRKRGKQLSWENIAASLPRFYEQSKHSLEIPLPSFPQCHMECDGLAKEKKKSYIYFKNKNSQTFILEKTKLNKSHPAFCHYNI